MLSDDEINDVSPRIEVINSEIPEVFSLKIRHPCVDFIDINKSYDIMGSPRENAKELKDPKEVASFRINIREVARGFVHPKLHM